MTQSEPVWPDWAIYWTLGNFLKPLATINLSKSPAFLGNFCKCVKSLIFIVRSFWATFLDIWQFFSGHTGPSVRWPNIFYFLYDKNDAACYCKTSNYFKKSQSYKTFFNLSPVNVYLPTYLHTSVIRLGDFFKFLGHNISCKSNPNVSRLLGYFENIHFQVKTAMAGQWLWLSW